MKFGGTPFSLLQPSSVVGVRGLSGIQPEFLNMEDKGIVLYVKVSITIRALNGLF